MKKGIGLSSPGRIWLTARQLKIRLAFFLWMGRGTDSLVPDD
jgi:hypothetical protein